MQFSSQTDIAAPLAFVYATLADFDHWEAAARRRGAMVTRLGGPGAPAPGLSWTVRFAFRGKDRAVDLRLVTLQEPGKLAFAAKGRLLEGDLTIDLVPLGEARMRMVVHLAARPLTLGARLMLQSVALAKGRTQGRLDGWLKTFAADVQARHARAGSDGQPRVRSDG